MQKYRGDNFIFRLTIEENGEQINFKNGDIIKFGMKKDISQTDYDLYQEITISEESSEYVEFNFTSDKTKNLSLDTYKIEIELTRAGIVETIYRDTLTVLGDVVNDRNET